MLAIEVDYLLGRAVATDSTKRDAAEWPPHPSRLFSGLVDALADVGADDAAEHAACDAALRWLERQEPPAIHADTEPALRTVVKHFVPVNDESVGAPVRSALLVDQRKRQERFFPTVTPANSRVVFVWRDVDAPPEHRSALCTLASRVPYLGHSSSAVRVWCMNDVPSDAPSLIPSIHGMLLRVAGPGRLDRLVSVYELRRANTSVQAPRGKEVRYAPPQTKTLRGPHLTARVFEMQGAPFGLEDTATVVQRFRAAVLSFIAHPVAEVLSGHAADGSRSSIPHVAYVPLGNVGHKHADGSVKGLAILLPHSIDDEDVLVLDSAVARVRLLHFGQRGDVRLRPHEPSRDSLQSLQTSRYGTPSRLWASVTPIVLGRHPKPKRGFTAESVVTRELELIGLPRPTNVRTQDTSFIRGAPPAHVVRRGSLESLAGRVTRHALIEFDTPVEGPLVVGAGRHMGFGLMMPVPS